MKTKHIFLIIALLLFTISISHAQNNTFTGNNAGQNNTGDKNSGFGEGALKFGSSNGNSALGFEALKNISGLYNVGIGYRTLSGGTSGNYNIAIGHRVLENNTSGKYNIAIGNGGLAFNITGHSNLAIGPVSLRSNTSGVYNTAMGYSSGFETTTGSRNTFLGYGAGRGLKTGNDNVALGSNLYLLPDTERSVVIGAATEHYLYIDNGGFTGIGLGNHNIPQNRLELDDGVLGTSGLRFRNYTSASPANFPNNGKVLTVNENGDVVLTNDLGGGSGGSNVNIYTADGTLAGNRTVTMSNNRLLFNTATNGSIYIGNTTNVSDNANFPTTTGNYRLYVEGGILTEKVKVALRSTANWADFVFSDDYKIATLKEVEAFIKKNKHLPGIESAEELVENGLDLADMQAKQMQKIEELTLYVIEQNKTLAKQSEEIEILKAQVKALLERK